MAHKDVKMDSIPGLGADGRKSHMASVERLVREFNESLVRMLKARLGSYEDAQEVAQEAYVRLLNLDEARIHSYHRALLFKIAKNLATDRLRRRAYLEVPNSESVDTRPDYGMDPERSARAREVVDALPDVLAELPWKCAEAFRQVRIEQRSTDEVARSLGVTKRMVRMHVARALVYCQERFDEIRENAGGPR